MELPAPVASELVLGKEPRKREEDDGERHRDRQREVVYEAVRQLYGGEEERAEKEQPGLDRFGA